MLLDGKLSNQKIVVSFILLLEMQGQKKLGLNIDIKATNIKSFIKFVKKEKIDLTLAIPDDPLAIGIVDEFQKKRLRIFGPTKAAAQL